MRFHIQTSTHGPVTRHYVIDSHDGLMVTWSDDLTHAQEWRDLYNDESTSPPHMYGEYCECPDCTSEEQTA